MQRILTALSTLCLLSGCPPLLSEAGTGPYFGSGARVGEVDQGSALIWTRLTREPDARFERMPIFTEGLARSDSDAWPLKAQRPFPSDESNASRLRWSVEMGNLESKK